MLSENFGDEIGWLGHSVGSECRCSTSATASPAFVEKKTGNDYSLVFGKHGGARVLLVSTKAGWTISNKT